eukprot:CCRYP_014584-RA/>CCRYP_014584-RA protein AED:0.15 eAED:0.15 QI:332/1/1/1/0.57/0.37/8/455/1035
MASLANAAMNSPEVATSTASTTDSPSQGSGPSGGTRLIRDRLADEKTRIAKEKENEYWRSIVPSPCSVGLEEVQADDVFAEVSRRVRRECQYLCLIPPEGFEAPSINGELPKAKRHIEWLRCASILVVTSLNLDSPNPIGWEPHEDSFTLSRLQSGEVAPSYWILGAFCRLRGAQPWQATRSYIASKVYELLEAEGWESWITSESRWDALGSAIKPTIEKYLRDSNPDFNDSDNSNLLNDYTHEIWKRFASDHLKMLHGQSAALPPIYSLTENYVKFVGAKLEMSGILPGSLLSSAPRPTEVIISELELRSLVTKRVKKLQYDYFPLIQESEEALQGVCDKVLDRLHTMSHVIHPEDLSNSKLVASILNDLEDESAYLSIINQLFRVRVCLSDISDPSVSSADVSSFLLGSRSSAVDCESKTNSPIGSINGKAKRSSTSSESSRMGGSTKRSKSTNVESSTKNPCNKMGLHALTLAELREAACGSCILCSMPDCERCFTCVENECTQNPKSVRCCIRKMCCNIPTQLKCQPAVKLGLPDRWRFTFDDPQRKTLVRSDRSIAPAGLKIISPDGKQYNSLQSAFDHIQHSSVHHAIQLVETFLTGIGSFQYASCQNHFLVGKNFSVDFVNDHGMNMSLFGKIVACVQRNSTPSNGISNDETAFFILQYHNDVLDVARNMGANIPALSLITSVTAWGGCIAFERKIMCRPTSQSVIANIDQATPAETWITPDVQWEEMISQADGTKLPKFSIMVRGYKIVFRAKVSYNQDGVPRYGLFASCSSLKDVNTEDDELNFKPGELVDLGVCSPLREADKKELCVFIIKNYIHSLKCGRWAFFGNDDNVMYDATDEDSGDLHDFALTQSLSYARKCHRRGEYPTIHARLDPSGKVHCLLGVPYQGNWSEYEVRMRELAPLFSGQEMEMTILHGLIEGNNKRFAETKHLQVIRMFQLEDVIPCFNYLIDLIPNPVTARRLAPKVLRRTLRVVHCLEIRTRELMDTALQVRPSESCANDIHSSFMSNTFCKLQAMKQMLEMQMEG